MALRESSEEGLSHFARIQTELERRYQFLLPGPRRGFVVMDGKSILMVGYLTDVFVIYAEIPNRFSK